MTVTLRERLIALIEPVLAQLGYELVELEYAAGRTSAVVRIFIDQPAGISVDDCERVSRDVAALLDVDDPIPTAYTLEVSSPGVNRRLARPEHYARYVGQRIRVRTVVPLDGRRNFLGELLECTPTDFALRLANGAEVRIAYAAVQRANYEHDFGGAALRKPSAGSAALSARKGRRT